MIFSALVSLFVRGKNIAPTKSYAAAGGDDNDDYKSTMDYKDSINKDIDSKSKKPTSIWTKTTSARKMTVGSKQTTVSK